MTSSRTTLDTFLRLVFLSLLTGSLHAEETPPATDEPQSSTAPRIIGDLPDGSPPPPAAPKPRLQIPAEDVTSSKVRNLGEVTVTFQKVKPIELPPLPAPPATVEGDAPASAPRNADHQENKLLFLGASAFVFSQQPNQPRSFVRYWATLGSEPISFWTNANFLYLTGVGSFADSDGQERSLVMSISKEARGQHEDVPPSPEYPSMPEFTDETKASFVVVGGNPTEEDMAPIRSLMELYNHSKNTLREAYLGRTAAEEQRAQELRDNPPKKKNLILKYWRIDEAGKAGETSKPAVIR